MVWAGFPVSGAILSDHIKSLDWKTRKAEFKGRVPKTVLAAVLERVAALLT